MAMHTFTVKSSSHGWEGEFKVKKPTNLKPASWAHLLGGKIVQAIIDLAFGNWIIKVQAVMRECKTVAAAEHAMLAYRYGGKRAASVNIVDAATFPGGMTAEQVAWMESQPNTVVVNWVDPDAPVEESTEAAEEPAD